jgi:sugar transferase (PEP-CTERM system associated)
MVLFLVESVALIGTALVVCRARGADFNDLNTWQHAVLVGTLIQLGMIAMGLYSPRLRDRSAGLILRVSIAVAAATLASMAIAQIWPQLELFPRRLAISGFISWPVIVLIHVAMIHFAEGLLFRKPVLVLGNGERAASLTRLRRRADKRSFRVVGYVAVDDTTSAVPENLVLREAGTLLQLVRRHRAEEIVVAIDERRHTLPIDELLECRLEGVEIIEVIDFLERETGKLPVHALSSGWLIFGRGFRRDIVRRYTERTFDLASAMLLLLLAWPFMLATVIAIKLEEGWRAPVFYRQARVGYGGRVFEILKFRSMRTDAERAGEAVWARKNDSRVTRVGSMIRKLRIDELPQVLNVLRGDMGLVGPRPERVEFVAQLSEKIPFYHSRHYVKPGITGWAQLCYPYGASDDDALEKLQYDLYYVKNHGLLFDLLILLQTVEVILLGKGAR